MILKLKNKGVINVLKGISASPGIAIGNVLVKKTKKVNIDKYSILEVNKEVKRLKASIEKSRAQIKMVYNSTLECIGKEEAAIFDAHLMILNDPEVFGQVERKIRKDKINAEWAIKEVRDSFVEIFKSIGDEYLRERIVDLKDVTDRVLNILLGIEIVDLSKLNQEVIIIADELTPSDTAQMDKSKVLGLITEAGGRTSHSAIIAKTIGIPAIVGVDGILKLVKDNDFVVFDGEKGEIFINPDKYVVEEYKDYKVMYDRFRSKLLSLKGKKSITKDGYQVELVANIGTPEDVESVIDNDGEGVGLYRSEFLYMDRASLPTEEEQFKAYKLVTERLKDKPIVIRTLDIGGDKKLSYLNLKDELNPFLGYRAIRLCLDRIDIFKTQLRALLRASAFGNIKIMFPMISSIEELRQAKKILEEVKQDLKRNDIAYNENIEVGIMVEIPAVAILSDLFAKEVDFFSIGTNDLIQYITAVDRGNQKIAHLYNQFHPALLRLIKMAIDNAHREGIWVGMCGEVAGDTRLIPILIGMGLDELSMSPISILKARWIIKQIRKKDMEQHIEKIITLPTAEEVRQYIHENIKVE